jgi:hypothetical protein
MRTLKENEIAASLAADDQSSPTPRYGRAKTVEHLYGIRRGSLYNLVRLGRVRSCTMKITSKRTRTRLFDLESIEKLIESEMSKQNGNAAMQAELDLTA